MAKGQRKYTYQQRAEALAYVQLHDGNVYQAAKQARVPQRTLNTWAHKAGVAVQSQEVAKQKNSPTMPPCGLRRLSWAHG